MLEAFKKYDDNVETLIPIEPTAIDSADSYQYIIQLINAYLSGDTRHPFFCAILVTNWMRGYKLSYMISDNWKYWRKQNKPKSIDSVIRDTMNNIETYCRFEFAKYSKCYIDILKYYLQKIGKEELCNKIPELNIWLEFGVASKTQISLISLGLSRNTSIILYEYIANDNLNIEESKEWIKGNLFTLDLSPIIVNEINTKLLIRK